MVKAQKVDTTDFDRIAEAEIDGQEQTMKGSMAQLNGELESNKQQMIQIYEKKYRDLEHELALRLKVELHEM